MSLTASGLRLEQFRPQATEGHADQRTLEWFRAVRLGFHSAAPSQQAADRMADAYVADGRILWGVYDDAAESMADVPVATYASMRNRLTVGPDGPEQVDAHLITSVTVRGTHRRRGLLRAMITTDLAQARDDGAAVAALGASEATIYGRFGFGVATHVHGIDVDVRERFAVAAPPAGHTAVVDPAEALTLAPHIFARAQAHTFGALGRQESYRRRAAAQWQADGPEPDPMVRFAVHHDDGGEPDGYVSYKFAGWDTEPPTIKVLDLVAVTDRARLELWRYLGAQDLVEHVRYPDAPVDDVLPWALTDRRCYRVTAVEDHLWLRILDPVAALRARAYRGDGAVVLGIDDPLGLAGGTYRLTVTGGVGHVVRLDDAARVDVRMPVDSLGSLYLGGVRAGALASAGRLDEVDAGAAAGLDELLGSARAPYCNTHF